MDQGIASFIHTKRIDSYQKLRCLLLLHQQPSKGVTGHELADDLFLGHAFIGQALITDLHQVGLIDQIGDRYGLRNDPAVKTTLKNLANMFADPLRRQALIKLVRCGKMRNYNVVRPSFLPFNEEVRAR